MNYGQWLERGFAMSDAVWMRHANPWSGWTRVATALPLFLAIWSHVRIGWWALVPLAFLALWLWLNPRLFRPPQRRDAWMTRAVFGERVWLNRKSVPIPHHHASMAHITSAISALGLLVAIYGFIAQDLPVATLGWAIMIVGKLWFLDRMVWLYSDMKGAVAEYRAWTN